MCGSPRYYVAPLGSVRRSCGEAAGAQPAGALPTTRRSPHAVLHARPRAATSCCNIIGLPALPDFHSSTCLADPRSCCDDAPFVHIHVAPHEHAVPDDALAYTQCCCPAGGDRNSGLTPFASSRMTDAQSQPTFLAVSSTVCAAHAGSSPLQSLVRTVFQNRRCSSSRRSQPDVKFHLRPVTDRHFRLFPIDIIHCQHAVMMVLFYMLRCARRPRQSLRHGSPTHSYPRATSEGLGKGFCCGSKPPTSRGK